MYHYWLICLDGLALLFAGIVLILLQRLKRGLFETWFIWVFRFYCEPEVDKIPYNKNFFIAGLFPHSTQPSNYI